MHFINIISTESNLIQSSAICAFKTDSPVTARDVAQFHEVKSSHNLILVKTKKKLKVKIDSADCSKINQTDELIIEPRGSNLN